MTDYILSKKLVFCKLDFFALLFCLKIQLVPIFIFACFFIICMVILHFFSDP